jgi:hypothetical protein
LALACALSAAATDENSVEVLQRLLRERDEEISRLRRQVDELRSSHPIAPRPTDSEAAIPAAGEDDELAGALESALVRQGGRVLPRGTYEIEPQISYFYDEPVSAQRRDSWIGALDVRAGLGSGWQVELRLPYVIRDRWTNVGTSSGAGDVRLGVTTEILAEREGRPAVLLFAQWRTTSGDINRIPSTGFDQDALQAGLTLTKRQDPVVLYGSVSYTENFGTARLANGSDYSSGQVLGARLGAYLAATPDTSLFSGVSLHSSSGDSINGARLPETDRLLGMFELGTTTVIGRGKFLNITASLGFTSAAPRFGLAVSLPIRFE